MNKMKRWAIGHRTLALLLASTLCCALPAGLAAQSTTPTKLGDLRAYRSITADVATLVNDGNLAGAKARIKDLETLWDRNEQAIKPLAPKDWHSLDQAIDKALYELRVWWTKPDPVACKKAVDDLLADFDRMAGKK